MMRQRPRSPSAPLLTPAGLRFIFTTGGLKAGVGLALFFGLPALGYAATVIQTAVFLYESLAQLAFAYPARRIHTRPTPNRVLNAIVVASVVLQILTITFAPLRTMLGLVPLPGPVVAMVVAALLITVIGAETWTRSSRQLDRAVEQQRRIAWVARGGWPVAQWPGPSSWAGDVASLRAFWCWTPSRKVVGVPETTRTTLGAVLSRASSGIRTKGLFAALHGFPVWCGLVPAGGREASGA